MEEIGKITIKAKLLAQQDGQYINYVFENLDEDFHSLMKYVTCTRLPSWQSDEVKLNDVGFLECEFVRAGDEYFKRESQNSDIYQYSGCYFLNFIKIKDKIDEKEWEFK